MSLRIEAGEDWVCIGLACGAATALEVGAVDPRREDASFTTGVALTPGCMVPLNCAEGIVMLGPENWEDMSLD